MIAQWSAAPFGASPSRFVLALLVLGVVVAGALVVVAIVRALDHLLAEEPVSDADASGRRWACLPRLTDQCG